MPPAATVDALLPLSLLEAVRRLDAPGPELEAEYVGELRTKRLGLSDTVYAQIRRYSDAAKRSQRLPLAEAAAVARLVGRRPDAERIFRDAGIHLANVAYERISPVVRWMVGAFPALLARPIALRAIRRVAARYYNGTIERVGSFLLLSVPDSATVGTAPLMTGCTYYEASLGALLSRLLRAGGRVEHVRCATRNEGVCQWRADWRPGR
jgi:bacteriochlorophyll 4-vinyl reductase